jgi:hypothetical protein
VFWETVLKKSIIVLVFFMFCFLSEVYPLAVNSYFLKIQDKSYLLDTEEKLKKIGLYFETEIERPFNEFLMFVSEEIKKNSDRHLIEILGKVREKLDQKLKAERRKKLKWKKLSEKFKLIKNYNKLINEIKDLEKRKPGSFFENLDNINHYETLKLLVKFIKIWPKEITVYYPSINMLIKEIKTNFSFYKKKSDKILKKWKNLDKSEIEKIQDTVLYNLVKYLEDKIEWKKEYYFELVDVLLKYDLPQEAVEEFLFNSGAIEDHYIIFVRNFLEYIFYCFEDSVISKLNIVLEIKRFKDLINRDKKGFLEEVELFFYRAKQWDCWNCWLKEVALRFFRSISGYLETSTIESIDEMFEYISLWDIDLEDSRINVFASDREEFFVENKKRFDFFEKYCETKQEFSMLRHYPVPEKKEDYCEKIKIFNRFKILDRIKNSFFLGYDLENYLVDTMLGLCGDSDDALTVRKVMEQFIPEESQEGKVWIEKRTEAYKDLKQKLVPKYLESIEKTKKIMKEEGSEKVWGYDDVKDVPEEIWEKLCVFHHPEKEQNKIVVLQKNAKVTFVGDIHGYYGYFNEHLSEIIREIEDEDRIYVFTGDYMHRGYNVVDVIMTLFRLKQLYPNNIIILKGNHELDNKVNRQSLYKDLERTGLFENVEEVCNSIFEIFNELPVMLISYDEDKGRLIFSMHGGFPIDDQIMQSENFEDETIKEDLKVRFFKETFIAERFLLSIKDMLAKEKHLVWNDFNGYYLAGGNKILEISDSKELCVPLVKKKSEIKKDEDVWSQQRYFSLPEKTIIDSLKEKLEVKNILVVRAHQHSKLESAIKDDGRIVTLFTSRSIINKKPFFMEVNFSENFIKWDKDMLRVVGEQRKLEQSA